MRFLSSKHNDGKQATSNVSEKKAMKCQNNNKNSSINDRVCSYQNFY